MTERFARKLAAWVAKGKGGGKAGNLDSRRARERLVLIVDQERAHGTLPDVLDLRRYLIGTLGISLNNADAICNLVGKLASHRPSTL